MNSHKRLVLTIAVLLTLSLLSSAAIAGDSCKKIRANVKAISDILEDPECSGYDYCQVADLRGTLNGQWWGFWDADGEELVAGDTAVAFNAVSTFETNKGEIYAEERGIFNLLAADGYAASIAVTGGTGSYADAQGWLTGTLVFSTGSGGLAGEICTAVGAAAKKGVKMVPFSGSEESAVDPSGGTIPCTAPDGTVVGEAPALLSGSGRFTHLGKTTSVITVDDCAFDPTAGTLVATGEGFHTGANGDMLHARYTGTSFPDGSIFFDPVDFVGGTGRFENATGWATGEGINYPDGTGNFSLEGMISSVGSGK